MSLGSPAIEGLAPDLLRAGARFVARLATEAPKVQDDGVRRSQGLYGPLAEALFWAALARIDEDNNAFSRVRPLLELVYADLESFSSHPSAKVPIGGFLGLGGTVWGLTTIAHLVEEPSIRCQAHRAVELLAPRIELDGFFDVIAGSAGALLASLALLKSEPAGEKRENLLAVARACGAHLLAEAQECGAWSPRSIDQLQSGFAHGTSGIAYALLALHQVDPNPELLAAASKAFDFERSLFVPSRGRYLPFRGFDPGGTLLMAWCWGPPGIGLAQAIAIETLGDPQLLHDAQANLERSVAQKQTLEDHLCCGNLGRALILAHLSQRGFAPARQVESHAAVAKLVQSVLGRARQRGSFGYGAARLDTSWAGGFLKGTAGIGYGLLYLAAPDLVPAPLILGPPLVYSG